MAGHVINRKGEVNRLLCRCAKKNVMANEIGNFGDLEKKYLIIYF
jgi:hypothetical protein